MDLSKDFDSPSHELLMAKLEAYGFGTESLWIILSYLKGCHQRIRSGSPLRKWLEVILGDHQGSILGPILFNIFLNDLFLFIISDTHICNFADENTLHACASTIEEVAIKLEKDTTKVISWFKNNSFLVNPAKFQIMFLVLEKSENMCITIDNITVKASREVKLLGIKIDNKLNLFHIPWKCAQKVIKKVEHSFLYENVLLYKKLVFCSMLTYYQFLIT